MHQNAYYSLQQTKVTISLSDVNTTKQDSRYQIKKKLIHYIISTANKHNIDLKNDEANTELHKPRRQDESFDKDKSPKSFLICAQRTNSCSLSNRTCTTCCLHLQYIYVFKNFRIWFCDCMSLSKRTQSSDLFNKTKTCRFFR